MLVDYTNTMIDSDNKVLSNVANMADYTNMTVS